MPVVSAKPRQLVRATLAVAAFAAVAGTLMMCADRRIGVAGGAPTTPAAVRQAMWNGPVVAPVDRVRPHTPPWPAALVAAGDIVPRVLAPDMAPLPARRNATLARAFQQAEIMSQARAAADVPFAALGATDISTSAKASPP